MSGLGSSALTEVLIPVVAWVAIGLVPAWMSWVGLLDDMPLAPSSVRDGRLVLRARSRRAALLMGYPLSTGAIAAAVISLELAGWGADGPAGVIQLVGLALAPPLLLWSALVHRRRRVVVDPDGIQVINAFSSYHIPWACLRAVTLQSDTTPYQRDAEDCLVFHTPQLTVTADVPRGVPVWQGSLRDAARIIADLRPGGWTATGTSAAVRVWGFDGLLLRLGIRVPRDAGSMQLVAVTCAWSVGMTILWSSLPWSPSG